MSSDKNREMSSAEGTIDKSQGLLVYQDVFTTSSAEHHVSNHTVDEMSVTISAKDKEVATGRVTSLKNFEVEGKELEKELHRQTLYSAPHRRPAGNRPKTMSDSAIRSCSPESEVSSSFNITPSGSSRAMSDKDWRSSDRSKSTEPLVPGLIEDTVSRAMADSDWRSNRSKSTEPLVPSLIDGTEAAESSPENSDCPVTPVSGVTSASGAIHVTPENAQAIYSPNACIFVANLPVLYQDDVLESSLQEVFEKFGKCWISVRRDTNNNPFAHVQYMSDEDAERAVNEGRGILILGRQCRTEKGRANRLYHVSKRSGLDISESEAREFLRPMGGLDEIWTPSQEEIARNDFPEGFLIKATLYQKARDAQRILNKDPVFRVVPLPKFREHKQSPAKAGAPRYFDDISVYIGGLTLDVKDVQILELFKPFGKIKAMTVVRTKPENVFGFVEYVEPMARVKAIAELDGYVLNGKPICVRYKNRVSGDSNGREDSKGRGDSKGPGDSSGPVYYLTKEILDQQNLMGSPVMPGRRQLSPEYHETLAQCLRSGHVDKKDLRGLSPVEQKRLFIDIYGEAPGFNLPVSSYAAEYAAIVGHAEFMNSFRAHGFKLPVYNSNGPMPASYVQIPVDFTLPGFQYFGHDYIEAQAFRQRWQEEQDRVGRDDLEFQKRLAARISVVRSDQTGLYLHNPHY